MLAGKGQLIFAFGKEAQLPGDGGFERERSDLITRFPQHQFRQDADPKSAFHHGQDGVIIVHPQTDIRLDALLPEGFQWTAEIPFFDDQKRLGGELACNTGHMVFDALQKESPIPLVSIVEVTCAEAARRGYSKIGLLGTAATMELDFFKAPFRKAGMEVVTPDAEERTYIADHILNELEQGIIREEMAQHILSQD